MHFGWEYRKGVHNVADPISRNPALHALQVLDSDGDASMNADADMDIYDSLNVSSQVLQNVCSGYSADPWFADDANTTDLTYVGECWRRGELIIVPDVGDLQMCMSLHHDAPYAGHFGRDRTKRRQLLSGGLIPDDLLSHLCCVDSSSHSLRVAIRIKRLQFK